MLDNTFIKHWKRLISNVEKTCFQRLTTLLPNVGKHSYQTLGNTFAKGLEMSDNTYITYYSVKF